MSVPGQGSSAIAPVKLGIDVVAEGGFAQLAGLRIGLLTNDSSRDGTGRRTLDILARAPGVRLAALFTPEHGLGADKEGRVASGRHAKRACSSTASMATTVGPGRRSSPISMRW